MRLSTLIATLQRIATRGGDPDVMVSVQSQGELRGTIPAVGINAAHAGFDWDSGRVLLTPAQPVVALTAAQVEAIVKSVREGQSWHAYQTYKTLRQRCRDLEAQVARLTSKNGPAASA